MMIRDDSSPVLLIRAWEPGEGNSGNPPSNSCGPISGKEAAAIAFMLQTQQGICAAEALVAAATPGNFKPPCGF